jgi:hypothetical protein
MQTPLEQPATLTFPERGSLKGQKFHCCHIGDDHKPCHIKAMWLIQVGTLRLPACNWHRDAVRSSFIPEIHTWDLEWLTND